MAEAQSFKASAKFKSLSFIENITPMWPCLCVMEKSIESLINDFGGTHRNSEFN